MRFAVGIQANRLEPQNLFKMVLADSSTEEFRMNTRLILSILVAYLISGCACVKLYRLGEIDPNEKTVSMSAGGRLLTGDLKVALMKDGWTVYAIDKSKEIIRGVDDPNATDKRVAVYRESELAKNARYHLFERWQTLNGEDYANYDISLIDNKTGQEVVILSGHRKQGKQIVKIFIDALHGVEYDGWDRKR